MVKPRFKTCFISAPSGTDTSVLRRALEERAIRWFDQTTLEAGSTWIDAIDRGLSKADFVCVVLPGGHHGNILFELGIAYARHKPILAFLGSSAIPPTDILSLTYVRAEPKDPLTVGSALGTFLQHAASKPLRRISIPRVKATPTTKALGSPAVLGQEFEQRTANLLREAGYILSYPSERRDRGADFAVWIDEIEQSLGSPLLVEVKAGDLSSGKIHEAAVQLRHHVAKTHGKCALLVYWDRKNRKFPPISTEWPLVFQLGGEALTRLLRQGTFPQELVRLRNAAVHGEV